MNETPRILATFDAKEILGEVYGGNEGNGPNLEAGQGSEHDPK